MKVSEEEILTKTQKTKCNHTQIILLGMMDIIKTLLFFFFEDFKIARKKQQFILCLCRETGQYFEESLRGCEVVTNLNERENY